MSEESPLGLRPFHHFFLSYGPFLAGWSSFEVMLEIALMRILRLSVRETSTVFASLSAGAKQHILGALITGTPEGIATYQIITEASSAAERKGFAHGFFSVSESGDEFTLVRREIKGSHVVKPKVFTALTMQKIFTSL